MDGQIKTNEDENFGYFSVKLNIVQEEFSVIFQTINDLLKTLRIPCKLIFCDFVNHNGNISNYKANLIYLLHSRPSYLPLDER